MEATSRPATIVAFPADDYDFAALLRAALGVDDLTALNADGAGEPGWSIYRTMEQSASYRAWWELSGSEAFVALYARFVRVVVTPLFDGPILVQSRPTPRIVYADGRGEPRFHRDRDYGHHPAEVNFQVALTPVTATNAMWIESAAGAGDHRPAELVPGQLLIFDGANLSHGAVPNETGRSRVSFDFRAIPLARATATHRAGPSGPGDRGAHVFAAFGPARS